MANQGVSEGSVLVYSAVIYRDANYFSDSSVIKEVKADIRIKKTEGLCVIEKIVQILTFTVASHLHLEAVHNILADSSLNLLWAAPHQWTKTGIKLQK